MSEKIKPESIWETKEKTLLSGLDQRVRITRGLWKTLESVELEDGPEEVEKIISDYVNEIKPCFSKETLINLEEWESLEEEGEKIEKELRALEATPESEKSEEEKERYEELIDRQEDVLDEISFLKEKDIDLEFLKNLDEAAKDLINKNKYIKEILAKNGKEAFIEEFLSKCQEIMPSEEIPKKESFNEVIVGPFSVIFSLKEEKKKENEITLGSHFCKTPFIALWNFDKSSTEKEKESLIWHEKVHNYLATVSLRESFKGFRHFERRLKKCQKLINEGQEPETIEREKETLKESKVSDFINEQHEEIVAEISSKKEVLSAITKHKLRREGYKGEFNSTEVIDFLGFEGLCKEFSTAGFKIKEASKNLEKEAKAAESEEIKEICLNLKEELEKELIKVAKNIISAKRISEHLGREAEEKIEFLFLILKPTQYRHIDNYLKHIYGKEEIEAIKDKFDLVDNFSLTPSCVNKALKLVEKGIVFSQEEKDKLMNAFFYFVMPEIGSLEEMRSFSSSLEKLTKALDFRVIKNGEYEEGDYFLAPLFYSFLRNDLANDFKNIPDIYKELNEKEKKAFEKSITEYIYTNHLKFDLKKLGIEVNSLEEIKELSFWSAIKEIGLADKLSEIIEKIETIEKKKREK